MRRVSIACIQLRPNHGSRRVYRTYMWYFRQILISTSEREGAETVPSLKQLFLLQRNAHIDHEKLTDARVAASKRSVRFQRPAWAQD